MWYSIGFGVCTLIGFCLGLAFGHRVSESEIRTARTAGYDAALEDLKAEAKRDGKVIMLGQSRVVG